MSRRAYAIAVGVLAAVGLHVLARRVERKYSELREAALDDWLDEVGVDPDAFEMPLQRPSRGRPGYRDSIAGAEHMPDCGYPQRPCVCAVFVSISGGIGSP